MKTVGAQSQKLWEIVKPYFEGNTEGVIECDILLSQVGNASRIECTYRFGGKEGNTLRFEEVCKLYGELKKVGVADMPKTSSLNITIGAEQVTTVTHTYYIV